MTSIRSLVLSVFGAALFHAPLQAQTPEPVLDGRIDLGSYTLFKSRVGNTLDKDFKFDEAAVRGFIRLILANHRLEPAEMDALKELSRTDVETVRLTVNSIPVNVPVADAEGRRIIGLVLSPVDMEALWGRGPEGVRALAEIHGLSIAHKNNIQKFVAMKLEPAWAKSNINNQYEPFRKAISMDHRTHKEHGVDVHKEVCTMYLDGAKYLDLYRKDTIPDHLYYWLSQTSHFE